MMTGRGEIRTQNHVGYRLKGQRGRKKETHGELQKSVGKERERQGSIITVIMEGGSTCDGVMRFIVSC